MNDQGRFNRVHFHGSFEPEHREASQFVALIEYERANPDSLDIRLIWNGDETERRAASGRLRIPWNYFWLYPVEKDQPAVEILGIRSTSHNFREASIVASVVNLGITQRASEKSAKYHLSVQLQPSGILVFPAIITTGLAGEVEREQVVEGAVEIGTTFGMLAAREAFRYTSSTTFGDTVRHQAQRAILSGEIVIPKGLSLFEVHETLERDVREICAALSLCYRQEVTFYEVEYVHLDDRSQASDATLRRRLAPRKKLDGEELIHVTGLANGGLQMLVTALRATKDPDAVKRSIDFLAASYEATLEVAYFMAFSAMETILGACGTRNDARTVPERVWKQLDKSLRTTLEGEGEKLNFQVDKIVRKLPELKRPTLVHRMAQACKRMDIEVANLWLESGFDDGFGRAVDIRNGLFHAAKDAGGQAMYGDLVRVQTLTERLILRLLEWPTERLWVWRDQRLGRVNQP